MSEGIADRLRTFAERVVTRHGALVEWEKNAAEGLALLPPTTAALLGVPGRESLVLSHEPRPHGLAIGISSDFLDRAEALFATELPVCTIRLDELYLKQGALVDLIGRTFAWTNAKVRILQAQPTRVEYHNWHFLASVKSEDQWEDLITVTMNSRSGTGITLDLPLSRMDYSSAPGDGQDLETTCTPAGRRALILVEKRAAGFVSRMESHLDRDKKRLRDYYGALLANDDRRKHARKDLELNAEELRAKNRAVHLELRRKQQELLERYAITVRLRPIAVLRVDMPALAIPIEVMRKKARAFHVIYWNPLLKALEPMCCSRTGEEIFAVAFTDDTVAPVSPAALAPAASR